MIFRALAGGAAGLAGVLALAGCGNSSPGGMSSSDTLTSGVSSSDASTPAGAAGPRGPAASGTIAAISGTTMQVQNQQTGQVAVSWSSSTMFTHQVRTTLTKIKADDCVIAVAPTGTSASATSFTATTVTVTSPVNGSCEASNREQRSSGQPSRFPSGRPSKFPSGVPSGAGRVRRGAIAAGTVSSVSGSTLLIAARQPGANASATTNKTVTVNSSTKIITDATTTAHSLKVGKCVTAQGKADSTGAVAATSVHITDPVNGRCGQVIVAGPGGGKGD